MSYIDVKYLNLLSSMLPLFKKKGDTKQSVAKFNSGTSIAKEIGAKDLLTFAN